MTLDTGLSASFDRTVADEHTAIACRSGDVPVLATPQVLAWCEEATVAALTDALEDSDTSVGMRVRLDHHRATPVGATVSVAAALTRIEGRRLTFDVRITDSLGDVATGQVIRVVVDRDRFLGKHAPPGDQSSGSA